jgi:hypothetical protein
MATLSASFETGDLSEFDSTVTDSGDLSAHADAAYNGSYGMQAVLDDATSIYGHWTFSDKSQVRIGFWFNPNGFSTADNMIIAGGGATIGGDDWRVGFSWDSVNLNVYASATNDASTWDSTSDVTITDDWHWIEAYFSRSTGVGNDDGFVRLWVDTVDETPDASLENRDDDTMDFDDVNVGAGSVASPISETIYFDDIRANDTGAAIGPVSATTSTSTTTSTTTSSSTSTTTTSTSTSTTTTTATSSSTSTTVSSTSTSTSTTTLLVHLVVAGADLRLLGADVRMGTS